MRVLSQKQASIQGLAKERSEEEFLQRNYICIMFNPQYNISQHLLWLKTSLVSRFYSVFFYLFYALGFPDLPKRRYKENVIKSIFEILI